MLLYNENTITLSDTIGQMLSVETQPTSVFDHIVGQWDVTVLVKSSFDRVHMVREDTVVWIVIMNTETFVVHKLVSIQI